jgi:phosphoglycolate phosphatase-like HAD superfamily hydrolase
MATLPLILFDIDGTILRSGDPTHAQAVRLACQEFFGVDATAPIPKEVDLSGRTDRRIVVTLLAAYGIPAEQSEPRLPELFAFMEEYVAREMGQLRERVLPGVAALLDELVARDLALGLVTGNLPRIAEVKLAAAGVWEPFTRHGEIIGGFGHASVERDDLPPLALAIASRALGQPVVGGDAVIIGDTPHDITCGKACGARTLAVATGRFGMDALSTYEPDLLLPDLSDRETVLRFLLAA